MNQHARTSNNPEAIRSEINTTRERMDSTIDELTERIKGRHLIDEILGYFRSPAASEKAGALKQRMGSSAGSAVHSVMDAVKANPGPTAVIAAGIGWMVYNASTRSSSESDYEEFENEEFGDPGFYEGGGASYHPSHAYRPGEAGGLGYGYDESAGDSGSHGFKDRIGEKAGEAKERVGEAMSHLRSRARQRAGDVKRRAGEAGSHFQERTHRMMGRGRERMVQSVDEHPLGIGIGCLALGIIAGLALPTAPKVNEMAGERAERLRRRARETGRDYVEKGKQVVHAAADAVKEEAQSQGLTPDALRQKASAVAERAKETAKDTAREEGMMPGQQKNPAGSSGGQTGQSM